MHWEINGSLWIRGLEDPCQRSVYVELSLGEILTLETAPHAVSSVCERVWMVKTTVQSSLCHQCMAVIS